MKELLLFLGIMFFVYIAWVYTGGPARFTSKQGPYITPVTKPGEESQGYRVVPGTNPLNADAYPHQVGSGETIRTTNGYEANRFSSRPTTTTSNHNLQAQ